MSHKQKHQDRFNITTKQEPMMSAELQTTTEVNAPDIDAMTPEERFTFLNETTNGYWESQGFTPDTLDEYFGTLENNEESAEHSNEADTLRSRVYEVAVSGADQKTIRQILAEVWDGVRRKVIGVGTAFTLAALLAACGTNTPTEQTPEPTTVETDKPSTPELTPEQIRAEFEIPAGLSDQELAEAYVAAIDKWWNYGTDPSLKDDDRRYELGIDDFSEAIANQSKDTISETIYADVNQIGAETNGNIQANTIQRYIQSLLKGEKPFQHNLTLVSLDAVGDNAGIRVLTFTVRETTTVPSDPVNTRAPYQMRVEFVTNDSSVQVKSDTILNTD